MANVTTLKIESFTVPVQVSAEGRFYAFDPRCEVGNQTRIEAETLAGLKKKLLQEVRSVTKLEIPAHVMNVANSWNDDRGKITFEEVTVVGRHAGNNNILVRHKGSTKAEQRSGYLFRNRGDLLRLLTEDEKRSIVKARQAWKDAEKLYDDLLDGFRLNVDKAIAQNRKEAVKAAKR
jgi:hypothetical protein